MDRYRTPPSPPGSSSPPQHEGVLEFIIDLPPPEGPRPNPPPPPGAAQRGRTPLALGRNEPLGEAIGRIGTGLLDRAATSLSSEQRDRAIDDSLRPLEQSRALLRLVRSIIGERAYLFEDRRLREVSRALIPPRDDRALLGVLDGLLERFGDRLVADGFAAFRTQLVQTLRQVPDAQVAASLEILAGARLRYAAFPVHTIPDAFTSIEPGLHSTYANGQLRMSEAIRHRSDGAFRNWRSQVAYLRDQVTMLDPDWATLGLSERLRKLAKGLGEARHLVVLQGAIERHAGAMGADERELLRVLAIGRCQDLYRSMLELGTDLYADEPPDFTSKFANYWRSWRSH